MDKTIIYTPAPRPNFEKMTDKALETYLLNNAAYLASNDPIDGRDHRIATANLVADRRAEDYIVAKARAVELNAVVDSTSAVLQGYPRGAMGLTPDDVKRSAKWKADSQAFNIAFAALREFNGKYTKTFAAELRHDRQTRRNALCQPAHVAE